jgi:type I restriction enzyme S subunit
MRFLLRKQPTVEQRQCLETTAQVNFVPMEAVGENGGLNLDIIREKTAVEKGYTLFFDGDVVSEDHAMF